MLLSAIGNYLADSWAPEAGCLECWDNTLEFANLVEVPKVLIAIVIERPTPFMDEFWQKMEAFV